MTDPPVPELAAIRSALAGLRPMSIGGADDPERTLLRVLSAWLEGRSSESSVARTEAVVRDGRADLRIEAVAIRALVALELGRVRDALALARRASRMARSEGLAEVIAGLALARARRVSGASERAARIVHGLSRFAGAEWEPWIAWERALATGPSAVIPGLVGDGAAERLDAMLRDAAAGDRDGTRRHASVLAAHECAIVRHDAACVRAMIDPTISIEAAPLEARAWIAGREAAIPLGAHALGTSTASAALAVVIAGAGIPARRILASALPLASVPALAPDDAQPRVDAALSALALAGGSVPEAELFLALYGFAFERAAHRPMLDVLLHRARKRMAGSGEIRRDGELVVLTLRAPIAIFDPRCVEPIEGRAFRWLADHPRSSAREIADALSLPRRTAQEIVRALVADSLCVATKEGRAVHYAVEDTTFSEPTWVDQR